MHYARVLKFARSAALLAVSDAAAGLCGGGSGVESLSGTAIVVVPPDRWTAPEEVE